MFTHMLLPTDGSEIAAKGVEKRIDLATRLGAKITIITVSEPLILYVGAEGGWNAASAMADYDEYQAKTAAALLLALRKQAEAAALNVETLHVPKAQPADAIVETAKSRGCDLIVMASHGRRGFRRLILGSQTAEVVARSSAPVLVVPPDPSQG